MLDTTCTGKPHWLWFVATDDAAAPIYLRAVPNGAPKIKYFGTVRQNAHIVNCFVNSIAHLSAERKQMFHLFLKFFYVFSPKVAIFFKNPLLIRQNCGKIQVCEYVFRYSSAEMIFFGGILKCSFL